MLLQVAPLTLPLTFVPCGLGMQVENGDTGLLTCKACGRESYSHWAGAWSPDDSTVISDSRCTNCPANAICPGNATVVPVPGFWHSTPGSPEMHACPNPAACMGRGLPVPPAVLRHYLLPSPSDNTDPFTNGTTGAAAGAPGGSLAESNPSLPAMLGYLQLCQRSWYETAGLASRTVMPPGATCFPDHLPESASLHGPARAALAAAPLLYMEAQCAEGYEGNLCARCVPGRFLDNNFGCSKCTSVAVSAVVGE